MNPYARIADRRDTDSRLLEANEVLIDNVRMSDSLSATKTGNHPFFHRIELRLIGIGMSVLAYLLERAVLRSVKRGETRPSSVGATRL